MSDSTAATPADLLRRVTLLEDLLNRMVQGVMLVSSDQVVEVCNQRAIDLLGLPPDLMARRPTFREVLEHQWSTDEFSATPEELKQFVRAGGILDQPQCYERIRPNGSVIEVESVPLGGGGVLRTYTDVTAKRRDNELIRHRARHDGLTTLLNREAFVEVLTEHVNFTINHQLRFAVHYLDLDGFKPINDSLGHLCGDRVLTTVAERIRSVARDHDFVARIGGDEFAILQVDVDDEAPAVKLGERLLQALEAPIRLEGETVRVGASCGVALFPRHGVTAEQLLHAADRALYQVKAVGGGASRVYSDTPVGPAS